MLKRGQHMRIKAVICQLEVSVLVFTLRNIIAATETVSLSSRHVCAKQKALVPNALLAEVG